MPIALNNTADYKVQLQQIAQMAYGSGRTEKTSGGEGYIGLIGGHVIKFATHSEERPLGGIKVTDDIKDSCNALRQKLGDLAKEAFNGETSSASLHKIYASLGLGEDGRVKADLSGKKVLLSRKVVAKTLNAIQKQMGGSGNVWEKARKATATDRHRMTEKNTTFNTVKKPITEGMKSAEEVVKNLKTVELPVDRRLTEYLGREEVMIDDNLYPALQRLQKDLQMMRAKFADAIKDDLVVIASIPNDPAQLIGFNNPTAEGKEFARAEIVRKVKEFARAIEDEFNNLDIDEETKQTIRARMTSLTDESYETKEYKQLMHHVASYDHTDAVSDYQAFFMRYLENVVQHDGHPPSS